MAAILIALVLFALQPSQDLHSVNGKDVGPPGGHVFRCFTPPTATDPKPDCQKP